MVASHPSLSRNTFYTWDVVVATPCGLHNQIAPVTVDTSVHQTYYLPKLPKMLIAPKPLRDNNTNPLSLPQHSIGSSQWLMCQVTNSFSLLNLIYRVSRKTRRGDTHPYLHSFPYTRRLARPISRTWQCYFNALEQRASASDRNRTCVSTLATSHITIILQTLGRPFALKLSLFSTQAGAVVYPTRIALVSELGFPHLAGTK